ncbi:MAG: methylamine---glutamate N-methyltransferase subunit [Solirubrobacteraceae bacterium]|jgi:glutamate synthase domain-containing protein 1|nr:methylamine---glutamate N-methyltransferase subunit [Solirubrobacteraceae bacterium]
MCGIAGFFAKTEAARQGLGDCVADMLGQLGGRGPDSAGVAVYRDEVAPGTAKLSLLDPSGKVRDWSGFGDVLWDRGDQAVVGVDADPEQARVDVLARHPQLLVLSAGTAIETVKRTGPPDRLIADAGLRGMRATHAIGHTRMATESRVSTEHSHPFSTGADLCLVHNGSLSNHNSVRRRLRREGVSFQTDNDSEVAAGYLTWRLRQGDALEAALHGALRDLDGFFTFAVGTRDGFAVLRDAVACKPAVLAETDDWVAMASEHRALAVLPGAQDATVWEPEPAQVYSWSREPVPA